MRGIVRALGPVALVVGVILLAEAVATGGARVSLVLIVPVITGTTLLFAVAAGLLVSGLFFFPLAFARDEQSEEETPVGSRLNPNAAPGGSGGLILLGPVPIFFGTWRRNPPISYRGALVVGLALVVVVVVLLLFGVAVV